MSAFTADIINSFTNTGNYQPFDGNSLQNGEGRWFGYRHSNTADLLILYGLGLYYGQILSNGQIVVWSII